MNNITLKIGTARDPESTMKAINTIEGLASWWTSTTEGSTQVGEVITFRFGEFAVDMKVISSTASLVEWECLAGPEEWLGTKIEFRIEKEPETTLFFRHTGWAEESPFMHHCSMKWAVFLLSLRQVLEEGQGRPFPNDVPITNVGN
ncbi:MAG: SRPBCC domain-containing protein [Pseudomonadota bacterium]